MLFNFIICFKLCFHRNSGRIIFLSIFAGFSCSTQLHLCILCQCVCTYFVINCILNNSRNYHYFDDTLVGTVDVIDSDESGCWIELVEFLDDACPLSVPHWLLRFVLIVSLVVRSTLSLFAIDVLPLSLQPLFVFVSLLILFVSHFIRFDELEHASGKL